MMRSIVIDELLDNELSSIKLYLDENATPSGVDGLYWINLEKEHWSNLQIQAQDHEMSGSLYRLAVELGEDWVRFELLVRAEGLLNIGGGFTSEDQSIYVLRWIDGMLSGLSTYSPT